MADPAVKKEEVVEETPKAEETVISETDLLKGLQGLEAEAKGEEKPAEEKVEPAVPAVEAAALAKTVEEEASETLVKSLDVSASLKEFADLVGEHVDTLSKSFADTLTNQNASILAISGILEGLTKSQSELRETVSQYGEKPAAPASAKAPTVKAGEVLHKGTGTGSGEEAASTEITQEQISDGLMSLVKSATDDEEKDRFTTALVKFDATKQISDKNLARAITEHNRIAGQG